MLFQSNQSNNINTIFIMLGHECNLHCKYCLQHDVRECVLDSYINEDIYQFINNVANHPITLQFYGGEPLVYWNNITTIVNKLKDNKNINFSVITNGKLIDEEKVEFLNKYFRTVTISWDGRNTIKTRGYNVFESNKENIFKLNNFNISGVLSAYNYIGDFLNDCCKLNKDYVENYNGKTLFVNVDDLLEICSLPIDLKDFDYEKMFNQITDICNEYYDYFCKSKPLNIIKQRYIESKLNFIKYAVRYEIEPKIDRCKNGYEVLNLDLNGNLYKCHNVSQAISNINDTYDKYIKKIEALNKTQINAPICNQCEVQLICKNGCPLVNDKSRQEYYCKIINVLNVPIIELLKEMGNAVGGLNEEKTNS